MESSPSESTHPRQDQRSHSQGFYREFLAERDEILRHKWLRSEVNGRDIGFDNALTEWVTSHRSQWRRTRRECG